MREGARGDEGEHGTTGNRRREGAEPQTGAVQASGAVEKTYTYDSEALVKKDEKPSFAAMIPAHDRMQ